MNVHSRRDAGFTLPELTIAMVIFSTLTFMALPRYQDFQGAMAMKANARNLATNFRLAQQRSAAANRPSYMDFDTAKGFFTIWLDGNMDRKYDGTDEVRAVGFSYTDNVGGVPGVLLPSGTVFESTTFANGLRGLPEVSFASDGSVATAGEVVLKDPKGRRYKVQVSIAGGISIFQKVGASWIE